jgi:hypothetical protein
MAELVLTDVANEVVRELQERAHSHGRTPVEEAKAILSEVLRAKSSSAWAKVDEIYARLAASGQNFSDSADLLREDRSR